MGASAAGGVGTASAGRTVDATGVNGKSAELRVKLEDLELPPRRNGSQATNVHGLEQVLGTQGMPSGAPSSAPGVAGKGPAPIVEELFSGCEPRGQQVFREDGLVGTEAQQLQLLAHYAELCEDFRHYQRTTRAEGAPRDTDGAQLLLLSGPPGTGKTRHAVSFARALGLPLLTARPPCAMAAAGSSSATWAAQLRREVSGRDCAIFLDEIDQHVRDESFASSLRQFLDGVCQPTSSRVLVVGTTNRLELLPKDVVHRAEVVTFDRPEASHLAEMWAGHAHHLNVEELKQLGHASARAAATGRDVRHCASMCERRTAIAWLNAQGAQGYCHGAAMANCPGPTLDSYVQCIKDRAE